MIPFTISADTVIGVCYGHNNPVPFQGFINPTPASEYVGSDTINLSSITQGYTSCGHTFIFTSSNIVKSVNKQKPVMIGDQTSGFPVGSVIVSSNFVSFSSGV